MSRLIVKNLPSGIAEKRLRDILSEYGTITDLTLKYRAGGSFRHFGFVGFKSEAAAKEACEKLNGTYIDTCQIVVDFCKPLGEQEKFRPHVGTSEKRSAAADETPTYGSRDPKRQRINRLRSVMQNPLLSDEEKELLKRVIDEPELDQFLSMHDQLGSGTRQLWSDDKSTSNNKEEQDTTGAEPAPTTSANLEYLKKKIVKKVAAREKLEGKSRNCIKLKNLPPRITKAELKAFIAPLKPTRTFRARPGLAFAFLQMGSEADVTKALQKDRNVLRGRAIRVSKYQEVVNTEKSVKQLESLVKKDSAGDAPEAVADSGRLFLRNLSYTATEEELEQHLSTFGPLAEVHLPIDKTTRTSKGFALATFVMPENAVQALTQLDGTIFQGRVLHIIPAKAKPDVQPRQSSEQSPAAPVTSVFRQSKDAAAKSKRSSAHNWNTLFMGADVVTELLAKKYDTSKRAIVDGCADDDDDGRDTSGNASAAVRVALGETQIVKETKEFLIAQGVNLEAFATAKPIRSKTVFVIKNLAPNSDKTELRERLAGHGALARVVWPPSGVTVLVEYDSPAEARSAFKAFAYSQIKGRPVYVEWAPVDAFSSGSEEGAHQETSKLATTDGNEDKIPDAPKVDESSSQRCVFVKSISFQSTEADVRKHFEKCGGVESIVIATKPNHNGAGRLSMGFGFVQYQRECDAAKALKTLQGSQLDGATLQLSRSKSDVSSKSSAVAPTQLRADVARGTSPSTKLCVRNIAFQATPKEIYKLFRTIAPIKSVRLPKKPGAVSSSSHRGFGFVEFARKEDAKKCYDALGESTHLYGRRLVVEWAENDADSLWSGGAAEASATEADPLAIVSGVGKSQGGQRFKKSELKKSVARASAAGYASDD